MDVRKALHLRADEHIKRELGRAAITDKRNLSNPIDVILFEWPQARRRKTA